MHRLRACVTGSTDTLVCDGVVWGDFVGSRFGGIVHRLRACVTGSTDTLVCVGMGRFCGFETWRDLHRLRACATGGRLTIQNGSVRPVCRAI